MRLARFSTVRGRLLALLIAIALPIGVLAAIAAVTTYRTVIGAIEQAQERAANDFAVRTKVWYRGALRSLVATGISVTQAGLGSAACGTVAKTALDRIEGYEGALFIATGGMRCTALSAADLDQKQIEAALSELRQRGGASDTSFPNVASARYGQLEIGSRRYLAIYAALPTGAPGLREALLLIDPALIDTVFDLGQDGVGLNVALLSRGQGVIASRGNAGTEWLPQQERIPEPDLRWEAISRDGTERAFAARMVTQPDFYVLVSFDDTPQQSARIQFAVLLLAPLLTLALLCLVYVRAIDRHCVRWLRGIEATARARASLSPERAAILPDMPDEVRSVAEAFNAMIDEQEVRQRRLSSALDDNRFLVRELHHRVKNSLQVVQSYIGLAKRDYPSEARMALADAECHVHVLSSAYRFTLADGEMHPVRVDLFLEDVVAMISNLIRRREQWISGQIETSAVLSVDRIIPLGFLVVDVASRALRVHPTLGVTIRVEDIDPQTIEVSIETSEAVDADPPTRLFAGLVAQIETLSAVGPEGRCLGRWRIRHEA